MTSVITVRRSTQPRVVVQRDTDGTVLSVQRKANRKTIALQQKRGPAGETGLAGADGATWLGGLVAPTTEGNDGDFYFDHTGTVVYEKTYGAWTARVDFTVFSDAAAASAAAAAASEAAAEAAQTAAETAETNAETAETNAETAQAAAAGSASAAATSATNASNSASAAATSATNAGNSATAAAASAAAAATFNPALYATLAGANELTNTLTLKSANPFLYLWETDAAAGKKRWSVAVDNGVFGVHNYNDAGVWTGQPLSIANDGTWSIGSHSAATAAHYRANTATKLLATDAVWSAASPVMLTDASTIAVDLSAGINFYVTLGGNRTLGFPTNIKQGQKGTITVIEDATGGRTLAFGSGYKFTLGSVPSITTTANCRNMLSYEVMDNGNVWIGCRKNVS